MPITVLHTAELTPAQHDAVTIAMPGELEPREGHYRLHHEQVLDVEAMAGLRRQLPFDINTLPEGFDPASVRLVISDMDSTLISIECIDEIADFADIKPEVAAITEAAMRGEIDFTGSLTQRVALLKGLDEGVLQRVYEERLQLNPGAETLLAGLKGKGVRFALVSGGFTFFTERLQSRLGLDYTRANVLDMDEGKLNGKVVGGVIDGVAKRDFLHELCAELGITPSQVVAMGDGANDLLMMEPAGLGVAYRAKPKVQAEADVAINHGGLDSVLDLIAP